MHAAPGFNANTLDLGTSFGPRAAAWYSSAGLGAIRLTGKSGRLTLVENIPRSHVRATCWGKGYFAIVLRRGELAFETGALHPLLCQFPATKHSRLLDDFTEDNRALSAASRSMINTLME